MFPTIWQSAFLRLIMWGTCFRPVSLEAEDNLKRLDLELAAFFKFIDRKSRIGQNADCAFFKTMNAYRSNGVS